MRSGKVRQDGSGIESDQKPPRQGASKDLRGAPGGLQDASKGKDDLVPRQTLIVFLQNTGGEFDYHIHCKLPLAHLRQTYWRTENIIGAKLAT